MPEEPVTSHQNPPEELHHEQFLCLLMASYKRIFSFILTLAPKLSDAEDIMQKSVMIMFRKFNEFKPNSNFGAWGTSIARYEILKFREKQGKNRVLFDSSAFDNILKRTEARVEKIDERLQALESCLNKLNDRDKELIKMRYEDGLTIKEVAQKAKRPIPGMYKAMARIHNLLQACVKHTMVAWEMPS